ncbi:hypothetical protein JW905_18715, partial [bacterium]|nr:hypothetical protein [candidate division CSSED10-310 bacterium]
MNESIRAGVSEPIPAGRPEHRPWPLSRRPELQAAVVLLAAFLVPVAELKVILICLTLLALGKLSLSRYRGFLAGTLFFFAYIASPYWLLP